jgi:hypothetical protein
MMDEMMGGTYPALPGDQMVRGTTTTTTSTTADVGLDDGDLVLNSTTVTGDLHHLDSEEEKEEVTEITNYDNRDATNNVDMMDEMMGGVYPAPGDELASSTVIVSVPRRTTAAQLAPHGNNSSNTNPGEPLSTPAGLTSKARPSYDSLNVNGARNIGPSHRPGAYPARGRAIGSRPAWHRCMSSPLAASFRQRSRQSLILGELVEPSQVEPSLRRRYQELEQIVNGAVTGTAIIENSGAGKDDQNAASSQFGRKESRFWIVASFALLLVVGVILGVTISLTTNNDKDSPSIDLTVTPTQSPAPTTCTSSLDCLAEILLQNEVSDAEAFQDDSSPQSLALRWLANNDPAALDLDSKPAVIIVERYILAVLYFATSAAGELNVLNFLNASSSVCEWNTGNGGRGVFCNGDDLVVALNLCKSKHEEVIVLISISFINSPVYFPFSFGVGV